MRYRAELLDSDDPDGASFYEGYRDRTRPNIGERLAHFEHTDSEIVEHWILHQKMHEPLSEYRVVQIEEIDVG